MRSEGVVPEPRSQLEAAAADVEALHRRFPEIRDRLVAICRSLGGDAAEDAVQEAYLVARRTIGNLRDLEAMDGWLTTIAIRRCVDRRRRDARFRGHLPVLFRGQRQDQPRDLGLTELVEQLPPRQRSVTVLHYGYGYSLPEIATLLGLSHTNVRSIVMRARRRLYAAWQEANRE